MAGTVTGYHAAHLPEDPARAIVWKVVAEHLASWVPSSAHVLELGAHERVGRGVDDHQPFRLRSRHLDQRPVMLDDRPGRSFRAAVRPGRDLVDLADFEHRHGDCASCLHSVTVR